MEMTLARALKYRKRVVERIAKLTVQIQNHNSTMEGNEPQIDVKAALSQRQTLVEHLLAVRLAIWRENKGIEREIMTIPEIKGEIAMLRSILVRDGKEVMGYREKETVWTAQLKQKDIDQMVLAWEKKLDEIQDKIDKYNYTKTVTIPDNDFNIW